MPVISKSIKFNYIVNSNSVYLSVYIMASNNPPNGNGNKSPKDGDDDIAPLTPPTREVASLTFHIEEVRVNVVADLIDNHLLRRSIRATFSLTRFSSGISRYTVFSFAQQNFERQTVKTCDSLPHSCCALDSIHIVPRVFTVIIPRPPRLNILTFVHSGKNAIAPIQYRFNNPLEGVSESDRQAFTFNGWGQFWDSTFGMLVEWVFDLTDLIPYVGSPNHLPPMPHFDPSTWRIPERVLLSFRTPDYLLDHQPSNSDASEGSYANLPPPLEYAGPPNQMPSSPSNLTEGTASGPSTPNLAPPTHSANAPRLPLGRGAQLIQALEQMNLWPRAAGTTQGPNLQPGAASAPPTQILTPAMPTQPLGRAAAILQAIQRTNAAPGAASQPPNLTRPPRSVGRTAGHAAQLLQALQQNNNPAGLQSSGGRRRGYLQPAPSRSPSPDNLNQNPDSSDFEDGD